MGSSEGGTFNMQYIYVNMMFGFFNLAHIHISLMKFYKRKDLRELHVLCPNSGAQKKLIAILLKSQLLYISSSVITNRILINIPFFFGCLLYPRKPEFSFWR